MLDSLSQRLSKIVKTMRGQARLPSENTILGRSEIAKLPAGEQCIVSVDCPLIALSSGQYKLTVSMALKRSQKKVFFDNCDTVGILTVI